MVRLKDSAWTTLITTDTWWNHQSQLPLGRENSVCIYGTAVDHDNWVKETSELGFLCHVNVGSNVKTFILLNKIWISFSSTCKFTFTPWVHWLSPGNNVIFTSPIFLFLYIYPFRYLVKTITISYSSIFTQIACRSYWLVKVQLPLIYPQLCLVMSFIKSSRPPVHLLKPNLYGRWRYY